MSHSMHNHHITPDNLPLALTPQHPLEDLLNTAEESQAVCLGSKGR